jgi:prephenate dehydratase
MTLPIEPAANGRAIPSMELLTFDVISVAEDVELPVNSSLVEEVERRANTSEAGRKILQHKSYKI